MADFPGEIFTLIAGEDVIEGECIDSSFLRLKSVLPFDFFSRQVISQVLPAEMLRRISETPSLPVDALATTLVVANQLLPIQFLSRSARILPNVPLEWGGTTRFGTASRLSIETLAQLAVTGQMPVSFLQGVAIQTDKLPVDFLGSVATSSRAEVEFVGTFRINLASNLEIEFLAGVNAPPLLPVDATGVTVLTSSPNLPIESLLQLMMPQILPIEAAGEDFALLLVWNVRRPLEEGAEFPLSWLVVPVLVAANTLPLTWIVQSLLSRTFGLSWRVLPSEIITLFDADIQFPFGRADKI